MSRKAGTSSRVEARWREPYLLYLLNQHLQQNNAIHRHLHGAVIVILFDFNLQNCYNTIASLNMKINRNYRVCLYIF